MDYFIIVVTTATAAAIALAAGATIDHLTLAIAGWITFFWGDRLVDGYLKLAGLG